MSAIPSRDLARAFEPPRYSRDQLRSEAPFAGLPFARVGGVDLVALSRVETAHLMVETAIARRGLGRPLVLSSANGEVISRIAREPQVAALFAKSDLLNADGQPLVIASRLLCKTPLPERVATTDLFHDVAPLAIDRGVTCHLFGATEFENAKAVARVRSLYPGLTVLGASHGYHKGADLERKLDEINALKPDILWLALGVPHEQRFCVDHLDRLGNVGLIKTSGGLFNFLSGTRNRAPVWMQKAGLEWLYRIKEEPRRLFWRYLVTNPHAALLLMTRTG